MARYNLESLSSQDFEELIRDLLQAEWKIALEAFRSGRDRGIDLRYTPAYGGTTIVQCKHYVASGFSKLLTHLRDCELPKIRRLSPARYVVATSVGLTPSNKDQIVTTLQPFVLTVRDVLGADDIEGLLSRHRKSSALTLSYGSPVRAFSIECFTMRRYARQISRLTASAASFLCL